MISIVRGVGAIVFVRGRNLAPNLAPDLAPDLALDLAPDLAPNLASDSLVTTEGQRAS